MGSIEGLNEACPDLCKTTRFSGKPGSNEGFNRGVPGQAMRATCRNALSGLDKRRDRPVLPAYLGDFLRCCYF
jgi:hypothetical protein